MSTLNNAKIKYYESLKSMNIIDLQEIAKSYKNKGKYEQMVKFYLICIEKDCVDSMYMLGQYYYKNRKYNEAEKYYLMAINKGHIYAMYKYGCLLKKLKKYALMKEYFLMVLCRNKKMEIIISKKINELVDNLLESNSDVLNIALIFRSILSKENDKKLSDYIKSLNNLI